MEKWSQVKRSSINLLHPCSQEGLSAGKKGNLMLCLEIDRVSSKPCLKDHFLLSRYLFIQRTERQGIVPKFESQTGPIKELPVGPFLSFLLLFSAFTYYFCLNDLGAIERNIISYLYSTFSLPFLSLMGTVSTGR